MTPQALYEALRLQARLALGNGGFLRRPRDLSALFVSDQAPYAPPEGWLIKPRGALTLWDLTPEGYAGLLIPAASPETPRDETAFALLCLAGRLTRRPPWERDDALFRLTLLRLAFDEGEALLREMPPLLALRQRRKQPLPYGAGALILSYLSQTQKEAPLC